MKNGYDDPKVTPIAAARRKQAAQGKGGQPPRSLRDIVIGGVFVAMALGMVVWGGLEAYQWLSGVKR